jgi:hypothetical protein
MAGERRSVCLRRLPYPPGWGELVQSLAQIW